MPQGNRPILPALLNGKRETPTTEISLPKRRRVNTKAACDNCRRKKVAVSAFYDSLLIGITAESWH